MLNFFFYRSPSLSGSRLFSPTRPFSVSCSGMRGRNSQSSLFQRMFFPPPLLFSPQSCDITDVDVEVVASHLLLSPPDWETMQASISLSPFFFLAAQADKEGWQEGSLCGILPATFSFLFLSLSNLARSLLPPLLFLPGGQAKKRSWRLSSSPIYLFGQTARSIPLFFLSPL